MTLLLFVRHGATDAAGKVLSGRLGGFPLNALGQAEARAVSEMLSTVQLEAVYSSPLERALGTAERIAAARPLNVRVRESLTDIDFGAWSGRSIAELEGVDEFRRFNAHRAVAHVPEGERVGAVQARMVEAVAEITSTHPTGAVAVVSHADPIRFALAFFLGLALDHTHRLEIATGSISGLELNEYDARLLYLNVRGALAAR
ncbi:MAG TPA: histidine phosphatase family protein [Polyangiaceae bacterium]|jgi:probable phosphoglycerate mutase|nr:histidine phosphatase family protein [Polyangiaceae bacterium]